MNNLVLVPWCLFAQDSAPKPVQRHGCKTWPGKSKDKDEPRGRKSKGVENRRERRGGL